VKRVGPILIVLLLFGAGIWWVSNQGEPTPNTPDVNVDPNLPNADEVEDAGKGFLDWIYGLPPWVWTGVAGLIVIIILNSIRQKAPVLFWIVVGGIIGITIFVASQNR